jgi:hypothetical protein
MTESSSKDGCKSDIDESDIFFPFMKDIVSNEKEDDHDRHELEPDTTQWK